MNIVVNTQTLVKGKLDGIGWFTYETLKRITQQHPEHTFYFVFDRPYHKDFIFADNVKPLILFPPSRHPFLWFIRFEILMPFLLKKYKADVFLSPDGWLNLTSSLPSVQVIHDLNFEYYPHDIPFLTRMYYTTLFPRYARRATRIATVSNYSKEDIIKTYGIPSQKIDVTPNGCNPDYKSFSEEEKISIRKNYTGGNPYFLYVGALIPRKNVANLFSAFDNFKKRDTQNTKLLIAGQKKWWTSQINEVFSNMQYKEDLIFLGRMNIETLKKLYAGSIALTYVSYFEGFGIPILEAFNAETAVITSNCTSMPEVAGNAAVIVNPFSIESITEAMLKLSNDSHYRQELIEKSKKQKELFSWDITAHKLWRCIEKAMKNK